MTHQIASITLSLLVLLFTTACADDPAPRDLGGSGPLGGASSDSNDPEAEEDSDADADSDADTDADAEPTCSLEPSLSDSPTQPCCFTDADCTSSNAPDAEFLRCYRAQCQEGADGICLIDPRPDLQCWTDRDCPTGQRCQGSVIGSCSEPLFEGDLPGSCR